MKLDKPVEYTHHAWQKMLWEQYVGYMVEKTIADRDDEYPGDVPESVVAVKKFNGLTLYVCYIEFEDYYRIITVFDDDEVCDG